MEGVLLEPAPQFVRRADLSPTMLGRVSCLHDDFVWMAGYGLSQGLVRPRRPACRVRWTRRSARLIASACAVRPSLAIRGIGARAVVGQDPPVHDRNRRVGEGQRARRDPPLQEFVLSDRPARMGRRRLRRAASSRLREVESPRREVSDCSPSVVGDHTPCRRSWAVREMPGLGVIELVFRHLRRSAGGGGRA